MPRWANRFRPHSAVHWMVLGTVFFAWMNIFARLASHEAHWALVAFSRASVGALVAYSSARLRHATLKLRATPGMWARSVFGTCSMLATFYVLANQSLDLGDAVTLLSLTPVFMSLFAPIFLREPSGRGLLLGVALSTLGVFFVVRPGIFFGDHASYSSAALFSACVALFASVVSSFAMMMLRKISVSEAPESVSLHFSLTASSVTLVLALLFSRGVSLRTTLIMVLAGACAGLAQLAMTRAYSLAPAARVGVVGNLTVVLSALFGFLILNDRPSPWSLVGMGFVIGASVLVGRGAVVHASNDHHSVPPPPVAVKGA